MFLTLEDPNAKIKGSRDPLGTQPVWSAFARHVVRNLTMQTTSLRGFTVLLLGRYLTEELMAAGRAPREAALETFLRFEQLAAYARHVVHGVEGDIRGIERVKAHLLEKKRRVDIEASSRAYILGDQKVTGLWGLFSVSARVSRLISEGPTGIEPSARKFVEAEYRPLLEHAWEPLLRLVARGGKLNARLGDAVLEAVAGVLPPRVTSAECGFYGEWLRDGLYVEDAPAGRQARFRELLEAHTDLEGPTTRQEIAALVEAARKTDEALARRLGRIATLESVLAPATALFDHVLTCHGRSVVDAAASLSAHWQGPVPGIRIDDFRELLPEVSGASTDKIAVQTGHCAYALATGDYAAAIESALEWNAHVMHGRQGAPWARVQGGRLDVRYRGAEQLVPDGESLGNLWRNGYFIEPLKRITHALNQVATG